MNDDILNLFRKFAAGECTAAELEEVRALIATQSHAEEWQAVLAEQAREIRQSYPGTFDDQDFAQVELYERIKNSVGLQPQQRVRPLWPRIAAAASILIVLSAGSYFMLHKKHPIQQVAQNQQSEIKPGGNKAILTLANGTNIVLTGAKNGQLAQQANTTIKKTADGKVEYTADQSKPNNETAEIQYNTMTTPRGGRYEATLADGTHFILDAGSSIRYPVQFTGKERIVEITGQVYFEVTHNAVHPFKVMVRGQTIEDLGTEFNVNAYDDEPYIRTTLVNGSVKVSKGLQSILLKPGQQGIAEPDKNIIRVKSVNSDDVIAWKNGQTSFKDEDITEIMRQVSRWYDVDVKYEGTMPKTPYVGGISRNADLSDLLKILEFNDVHFKVDGRKIIVKP